MSNPENSQKSFDILKPGSSLEPSFLFALDCILGVLLVVLLVLAYSTSASLHLVALIVIELALWACIKWVVNELKNSPDGKPEAERECEDVKKRS